MGHAELGQDGDGRNIATEMGELNRRIFFLLLAGTLALSLVAVVMFDRAVMKNSLFGLANFVGPTTWTLLHGRGLTVCSEGMGTPGNPICFHAGRMPVPSVVVALGVSLLGDHYIRVGLFKALLLLIPLEAAIYLVCCSLPRARGRRLMTVALLVLPFGMTAFLADVVNLQVEEGYSYSLLALATALVLFRESGPTSWRRAVLFAVTAAGLYLAKSSMAPAVAVLAVAFVWPMLRRQTAMAAVTLGLVLLAPAGWAMWQHHAAGRYTPGTSLDGMNLHKGNDELFLANYPPQPGENLDQFDSLLNRGHHFSDEWSFNDYHQRAAVAYMRAHPGATAEADLRKLETVLISLNKSGSLPQRGALGLIESAGMVLFRLLLWAAIGLSLWGIFNGASEGRRAAGATFLLLLAAVALPYVVGFAYTRHVSVLIYPAALLCCRWLSGNAPERHSH